MNGVKTPRVTFHLMSKDDAALKFPDLSCKAKSGDRKASLKAGQIIRLNYKGRDFESIIIDPDGLGKNQPTIGLGFRMMERYIGIPQATLSNWTVAGDSNPGEKHYKVPSGKTFSVIAQLGEDNNIFKVIDVANVYRLTQEILACPGKTRSETLAKIKQFVLNFNPKDFYLEVYKFLGIEIDVSQIDSYCAYERCLPIRIAERRNPEKAICQRLWEVEGGVTEVITPAGNIDLLTPTEVVEIKKVREWKHAVGQVLVYHTYYPSHTRRIHLFGNVHSSFMQMVEERCKILGIKVTWEI